MPAQAGHEDRAATAAAGDGLVDRIDAVDDALGGEHVGSRGARRVAAEALERPGDDDGAFAVEHDDGNEPVAPGDVEVGGVVGGDRRARARRVGRRR